MVKRQRQCIRKERNSKRFNATCARARIISALMEVEICGEQLSPFGGLLGLITFLDLFDFKEYFEETIC